MKILLLFLMAITALFSDPVYPELFSELGTPQYKADALFSKLPDGHQYSTAVGAYHKNQKEVLDLAHTTGDKKVYFKALRTLSKEYDTIISMLKREIITAIKDDDYAYFIAINDVGIAALYQQDSLNESIYAYYRENKAKGSSDYLEERIRSEKGYKKLFGSDISSGNGNNGNHPQKSVILISRPGCGWCDKAKAFMRSNHISFTEHNIQSSAIAKKLYQRHNGSGVPLIIIEDSVIRGYNESAILNAL